jgi:hypothetical protein
MAVQVAINVSQKFFSHKEAQNLKLGRTYRLLVLLCG